MTPEEAYDFLLERAMKNIGKETTDVLMKVLEADQIIREVLKNA